MITPRGDIANKVAADSTSYTVFTDNKYTDDVRCDITICSRTYIIPRALVCYL